MVELPVPVFGGMAISVFRRTVLAPQYWINTMQVLSLRTLPFGQISLIGNRILKKF
jgi:hypothetical protein